ncbi:class I SAM-dependent methyltransferase [Actinocorallia sp. B10E7]|uniref:class I SAM-dependent methyltransferase n=1 Tax=Actinocorallia sp. B10E7 TaxID=3153558 RepID=UPI00325EDC14
MGTGKPGHRHAEHPDGGTIDHPAAYEALSTVLFFGRRRRVFSHIAVLTGASPGGRVLDVGCGTGYLTRLLSRLAGPTGAVTGLDLSPSMIDYARKHAPANCSYVVAPGQDMPFEEASFDVVVSSLAVHHIPASERAAALREMHRVLRPGGRLLIVEFRPPTHRTLAHVIGRITGPAMRHDPKELLEGIIADAGFVTRKEGALRPFLYYVAAARQS